MNQCRVFLKSPKGELKKIYSIRADDKGAYIQVQVWTTIVCKDLGVPLNSEIHYQIPSNGKDFHLTIKYKDHGPFTDPEIKVIENYLYFYPNRFDYKHKQVIVKNVKTSYTCHLSFTEKLKPKYMIGYPPVSFNQYRQNIALHPVYYLTTICTSIAPLSDQKLKDSPWEKGDPSNAQLSDKDIVIEESNEPEARITVCGFICCPGQFSNTETSWKVSRVINIPSLPDFGINVIFCHKFPPR